MIRTWSASQYLAAVSVLPELDVDRTPWAAVRSQPRTPKASGPLQTEAWTEIEGIQGTSSDCQPPSINIKVTQDFNSFNEYGEHAERRNCPTWWTVSKQRRSQYSYKYNIFSSFPVAALSVITSSKLKRRVLISLCFLARSSKSLILASAVCWR